MLGLAVTILGCWLCDKVDHLDHIDWLRTERPITFPLGDCALPLDSHLPSSPSGFLSWWPSGVPSSTQNSPTRSPSKQSHPLAPAASCSTDLQQTMVSIKFCKLCLAHMRKWFHRRQLLRRRHQSWSRIWELKSSAFFRALQFPMLPADDWQQCGLTDLSDLQSQSHTVCTIAT